MTFGNGHWLMSHGARSQLYSYTDVQGSLGNVVFSCVACAERKLLSLLKKGRISLGGGHSAYTASSIIPYQKEVTARSLASNLFLVLGFSHSMSRQVGRLPSGLCEASSLCKGRFVHVKHRKAEP